MLSGSDLLMASLPFSSESTAAGVSLLSFTSFTSLFLEEHLFHGFFFSLLLSTYTFQLLPKFDPLHIHTFLMQCKQALLSTATVVKPSPSKVPPTVSPSRLKYWTHSWLGSLWPSALVLLGRTHSHPLPKLCTSKFLACLVSSLPHNPPSAAIIISLSDCLHNVPTPLCS